MLSDAPGPTWHGPIEPSWPVSIGKPEALQVDRKGEEDCIAKLHNGKPAEGGKNPLLTSSFD